MTLNELLPELLKLKREEMVQAIDILQRQVNANTGEIVDKAVYEVWSPTITLEAAAILQEVLNEAKEKRG
jgi:hypothetical protein